MKKKNKINKFSFWKENKISGFFQLTEQELIKDFKQWLPTKDIAWHRYYSITDGVNCFISESLTAIGNTENDFEEYRQMEEILKPIRRTYLENIEKKIEG